MDDLLKDLLSKSLAGGQALSAKEQAYMGSLVLAMLETAQEKGELAMFCDERTSCNLEFVIGLLMKLRLMREIAYAAIKVAESIPPCDDPTCDSCMERKARAEAASQFDLSKLEPKGSA